MPCLVTLRPLCKILLRLQGLNQNFLWATQVRFFLILWLGIVHFGLAWLWHIVRQFRIHLNFLQNFCVHSRPHSRSAAHPQLRLLQGLKHSTVVLSFYYTLFIACLSCYTYLGFTISSGCLSSVWICLILCFLHVLPSSHANKDSYTISPHLVTIP